jgi:uncharacterized repeat protein (TIGR04052 family)
MLPALAFPKRATATLSLVGLVLIASAAAPSPATRRVSLRFRAAVGTEPFACGKSYAGIGTSNATLTPSDFGFYVHGVELLRRDGTAVPLALAQDSLWQHGQVAMLDFENGTGPCLNGNAPTHTEVTGTVPEGDYTGVRFVIGVPFEENHKDVTLAPSPLSVSRMFWAWNSGYKFLRLDAKGANGKAWVMHLGSTGCTPTGSPSTVPTGCLQPNRVTVSMDQFDVDHDVVVADMARLFAGNGGDANQVCMSGPKSAACGPMFAVLGLPFNEQPASTQRWLVAERGGTAAAR